MDGSFRVKNDMNNAKKSVVVVANAGPTVVVAALQRNRRVDVNKRDDGGTHRSAQRRFLLCDLMMI